MDYPKPDGALNLMELLKWLSIALVSMLLLRCLVYAGPDEDARVAVAIASAKSPYTGSYSSLREKAAREKKPFIVWVRLQDTAVEAELCHYIHAHQWSLGPVQKGIVICLPDGEGDLNWSKTLPANATAAEIQATVERYRRTTTYPSPQTYVSPAPYAPVTTFQPYQPQFIPSLRGGFSTNCGPRG